MYGFFSEDYVRLKYHSLLITHSYGGVICLWCWNGGDERRIVPCIAERQKTFNQFSNLGGQSEESIKRIKNSPQKIRLHEIL